ncbi:MAG: translation elongation factor Ts [Casimicrobiaceae bacterium]
MADISASMVMELRQRTGLGMMECKKALTEANGDLVKAEELMRIKSGAKASKAAGRVAAEGIVGAFVAPDAKTGAMIEVNCETDFVSRNDDFIGFAKMLAQLVAQQRPADVTALAALPLDGGTVESLRQALVQKLGENIAMRRFERFATNGRIAQYLHGGGRIGVTVEFDGAEDAVGRDIAMHVAAGAAPGAIRPLAVSRNEVAPELIEKERAIYTAQAAESGKPADIVAKMVEGRVNKFLAEVTLLGQPFVKNPDETVEKYLKSKSASVKSFALYVVGEGIEKKKDDFAAEVAAMAKA